MPLEKIVRVSGRAVHVPGDDIDTDQIIPGRFLRCVTFDGLGEHLFEDRRRDAAGKPMDHPLNRRERKGAAILVSGRNFGCGSSREHAPQAIRKAGFRAVVAGSFAEIFAGNAAAIGLVCVALPPDGLSRLDRAVDADPGLPVTVDLAGLSVSFAGQHVGCAIREAFRTALMDGHWDPIGQLLEAQPEVALLEANLPYPR
jgi:3-isopropylmalate/(R)-2-methylmalate dehydratase small subunit